MSFRLALAVLLRDGRGGEAAFLALTIAICVAGVSAVGFFVDRVGKALEERASQLLGADLVLSADHPIPAEFDALARQHGLELAHKTRLLSMVSSAHQSQLVEVHAVSTGFPLRGSLQLRAADLSEQAAANVIPARGSVWVAERLAGMMGLQRGSWLGLGVIRLRVEAIISHAPDQGLDVFNVAPRVLMNEADLPASALIQPGSRIGYRLLVAGPPAQIAAFRASAEPRLGRGERLEGIREARPEMRAMLERGGRYLALAALLAVVLAAAALALGARRYVERQYDVCALLRTFGASARQITAIYLIQMLALGALAGALGSALGYCAQFALSAWARQYSVAALPAASFTPALHGMALALVLTVGLVFPSVLRLRRISALRLIRRDLAGPDRIGLAAGLAGVGTLVTLIFWLARDIKLASYASAGFALSLLLATALGWMLFSLIGRLQGYTRGAWRFGLAGLARRRRHNLLQALALGIGVMALLVLTGVRVQLLEAWRESIPAGAPNRFIINLQQDQVAPLLAYFQERAWPAPELYPMVRARLQAINGSDVSARSYADERTRRLVEREFNLSWARQRREDNQLIAGRWWTQDDAKRAQFSVEEGIAQQLGIRLGDRLTYRVADLSLSGTVTSIRRVNWGSFRANFFVIGNPGALQELPASYLVNFHIAKEQESALHGLVRAFPNVTLVDVAAVLQQVRLISDQATQSIEFVFLFSVAAGLLVLYGGLRVSQRERVYEAALLRSLGGSSRQIVLAHALEFLAVAVVGAVIALGGATLLGWALSRYVFDLPYRLAWDMASIAFVIPAAVMALSGWLAVRSVLRHAPVSVLRAYE